MRSVYFCKYINDDIFLHFEKYINNDGDVKYLDNINIKRKIEIKNKVHIIVNHIIYKTSCCLYLVCYKSLYYLNELLTKEQEKYKGPTKKLTFWFNNFFKNAQKRILNALKINQKINNASSYSYELNLNDILKNKEFLELCSIKNKILYSTDFEQLIVDIHRFFKCIHPLLQKANLFYLNPNILSFLFDTCTLIQNKSYDKKFSFLIDKQKEVKKQNKEWKHDTTSEDGQEKNEEKNTHIEEQENILTHVKCLLEKNQLEETNKMKYDYNNISSYLKNHDLILIYLQNTIYYIPFRLLEKKSITLLLYTLLLFFVTTPFTFDILENTNVHPLSKQHVGIAPEFFSPIEENGISENITSLFNFLILMCVENEKDLPKILETQIVQNKTEVTYVQSKTRNYDICPYHMIFKNIICSNYENINIENESFNTCLNFCLYILSDNYKDILRNLQNIYLRTNHVKRLEICNSIIHTFL